MRTLHKFRALLAGTALMCGVPAAAEADEDIPNLVGRWTIQSEGLAIAIPDGGQAEPVSVDSVFVIDRQDGIQIAGHEQSQRTDGQPVVSDEEYFAGIIDPQDRTVSMIDEDGFRDCDIVSAEQMVCIYRRVASPRAVVTRNEWTKQPE